MKIMFTRMKTGEYLIYLKFDLKRGSSCLFHFLADVKRVNWKLKPFDPPDVAPERPNMVTN